MSAQQPSGNEFHVSQRPRNAPLWISLKMHTGEVKQRIRSMFRIVKGSTFTHMKMVAAFDRRQPRSL
jgi:hypothetical protein